MNDFTTSVDVWCQLVETALADDSDASWRRAADVPLARLALPSDTEEALRQAERIAELMGHVDARRIVTRDELDTVTGERRTLVTHSRAVSSYRQTESHEPNDRLMRMLSM